MRIKYFAPILLTIFLLCESCATYISFTIATPPEITIGSQHNKVAFMNKYDYTNLPFENENKRNVFATAVQKLIASLESSINSDDNFSFTIIDSLVQGVAMEDFPEFMNENNVVSLCEKDNSDLLLVLDSFTAYFYTETEVVEDEDGGKSRTNYVDLIVEAGLTLYDKNGEVMDRVKVSESEPYQTRPALVSFIVIGPSMGKAGKKVNVLAKRIGENYIYNFYPGSKTETSLIYTGKAFKKVTPLMKNKLWSEAIDILLPLANSPDSKIAKKARYNLATAYKAMGDFEKYDYWRKKSWEL